jgi:hypothetical protein
MCDTINAVHTKELVSNDVKLVNNSHECTNIFGNGLKKMHLNLDNIDGKQRTL